MLLQSRLKALACIFRPAAASATMDNAQPRAERAIDKRATARDCMFVTDHRDVAQGRRGRIAINDGSSMLVPTSSTAIACDDAMLSCTIEVANEAVLLTTLEVLHQLSSVLAQRGSRR